MVGQIKPFIYRHPACGYWHYTDFNGTARLIPFQTQQDALGFVCGMLQGIALGDIEAQRKLEY